MRTTTTMIDRRLPSHLAILIGISAGAYAVSLAGVTALQSGADARLRDDREPARLAAATVAADHAELEAAVESAARRYAALAERYQETGATVTGMEASLDELAVRAATLAESAASLPTRFSLPTVRAAAAPRRAAPPKTDATTRASG
jgi:hypothetical protein